MMQLLTRFGSISHFVWRRPESRWAKNKLTLQEWFSTPKVDGTLFILNHRLLINDHSRLNASLISHKITSMADGKISTTRGTEPKFWQFFTWQKMWMLSICPLLVKFWIQSHCKNMPWLGSNLSQNIRSILCFVTCFKLQNCVQSIKYLNTE